jgi:DNA invertase Pin-like site-specific DNA recombinase
MTSQLTKEALARISAGGKSLGRKSGSPNLKLKLTDKTSYIRNWLLKGRSISEIARKLRVSRITLKKFIKKENLIAI